MPKGVEGFAAKEDKMSKHQSKKMKKRQKRDARVGFITNNFV